MSNVTPPQNQPISLSDVLYQRFPQSPKINEFITRHGCPHWYFEIPYNTDCWSMTCAECWERPVPCPCRYK